MARKRLRDGSYTHDVRLDRMYELDWNSLNFPVRRTLTTAQINNPKTKTWRCSITLDQGREGACVGNGYAHDAAADPVIVKGVTEAFAHDVVYWTAQREDPWPGGSYPGATPKYEGTSVLTGAKVMTDLGFYTGYDWALNVQDLACGIPVRGPAILGYNWYEGMMDVDAKGFIAPTGKQIGGHCILARGVTIVWIKGSAKKTWADVDLTKSYLTLRNSWGPDWGINQGDCKLSLVNNDTLLNQQGEACFPNRNTALRKVA